MAEPGKNVVESVLQHPCHFLHWFQPRANRPVVPVVAELPTGDCIGLIPEPAEVILDAPGSDGSQLLFLQSVQFLLTFFIKLLGIEEEKIAHTLETIITLLPSSAPAAVLRPAHSSTSIANASNISVNRECFSPHGTEVVFTPHFEQLTRGILAFRIV